MKAYSIDIRQKVVDAIDDHLGTYEEIAMMFGVHISFVYKLLRRRRKTGDIIPAPHSGGAQLRLDKAGLEVLSELIAKNPDATLKELGDGLRKKIKVKVGMMTIWRGVEKLGITLKKSHVRPRRPIQRSELRFKKSRRH